MKSIEPRAKFYKLFFFILHHFKTAHQYYFHIDYLNAIALSANKAVCVCVCVLLSICVYVCIYVQFMMKTNNTDLLISAYFLAEEEQETAERNTKKPPNI